MKIRTPCITACNYEFLYILSAAIRKQVFVSITLSPVLAKYPTPLYDQLRKIVAYKHNAWQATRKTNTLLISFKSHYSLFHKN